MSTKPAGAWGPRHSVAPGATYQGLTKAQYGAAYSRVAAQPHAPAAQPVDSETLESQPAAAKVSIDFRPAGAPQPHGAPQVHTKDGGWAEALTWFASAAPAVSLTEGDRDTVKAHAGELTAALEGSERWLSNLEAHVAQYQGVAELEEPLKAWRATLDPMQEGAKRLSALLSAAGVSSEAPAPGPRRIHLETQLDDGVAAAQSLAASAAAGSAAHSEAAAIAELLGKARATLESPEAVAAMQKEAAVELYAGQLFLGQAVTDAEIATLDVPSGFGRAELEAAYAGELAAQHTVAPKALASFDDIKEQLAFDAAVALRHANSTQNPTLIAAAQAFLHASVELGGEEHLRETLQADAQGRLTGQLDLTSTVAERINRLTAALETLDEKSLDAQKKAAVLAPLTALEANLAA